MCQNNLNDAAFDFCRVDPSNPHNPGGDSIIILDSQSGEQHVLTTVQHDARQPPGQDEVITVHGARTEGLLLPAMQDEGLLLPATPIQWDHCFEL